MLRATNDPVYNKKSYLRGRSLFDFVYHTGSQCATQTHFGWLYTIFSLKKANQVWFSSGGFFSGLGFKIQNSRLSWLWVAGSSKKSNFFLIVRKQRETKDYILGLSFNFLQFLYWCSHKGDWKRDFGIFSWIGDGVWRLGNDDEAGWAGGVVTFGVP